MSNPINSTGTNPSAQAIEPTPKKNSQIASSPRASSVSNNQVTSASSSSGSSISRTVSNIGKSFTKSASSFLNSFSSFSFPSFSFPNPFSSKINEKIETLSLAAVDVTPITITEIESKITEIESKINSKNNETSFTAFFSLSNALPCWNGASLEKKYQNQYNTESSGKAADLYIQAATCHTNAANAIESQKTKVAEKWTKAAEAFANAAEQIKTQSDPFSKPPVRDKDSKFNPVFWYYSTLARWYLREAKQAEQSSL